MIEPLRLTTNELDWHIEVWPLRNSCTFAADTTAHVSNPKMRLGNGRTYSRGLHWLPATDLRRACRSRFGIACPSGSKRARRAADYQLRPFRGSPPRHGPHAKANPFRFSTKSHRTRLTWFITATACREFFRKACRPPAHFRPPYSQARSRYAAGECEYGCSVEYWATEMKCPRPQYCDRKVG